MISTKTINAVHATVVCPCIACLGTGYDRAGNTCLGCKGAAKHWLAVKEPTVEEVDAWDDGPAWDAVVTRVQANGGEIDEDAWRYSIESRTHNGGEYTVTLKIEPYPVSKATAAAMNSLTAKTCDRCGYVFRAAHSIACACGGVAK